MGIRILLVEDECEIQRFLSRSLCQAGYQVDLADDARAAMKLAAENAHDVLIVDLGLPDLEGIDLIRALRNMGITVPVLILSARRSLDERLTGLEQGGDDYLTKPFALPELLARVRNLLRRNTAFRQECLLSVADLELDLIRKEAKRHGRAINLSSNEFSLLECLCRNAGQIVTRSMLLERVWGLQSEPKTNNLDVHMSRLRVKVDGCNFPPLIETLRGKGYVLKLA